MTEPITDQSNLLANLRYMRLFYLAFPIWNAVRTKLSWSSRGLQVLQRKELGMPQIDVKGIMANSP